MKTGMELVKELREIARERQLQSIPDVSGSYRGLFDAAGLLQAWLREVDEWFRVEVEDKRFSSLFYRQVLLGTRQEDNDEIIE